MHSEATDPTAMDAAPADLEHCWATRLSMRRGRLRECIRIGAQTIVVESNGLNAASRAVFPRQWARVNIHGPLTALHPSRLTIESHGRVREVGGFLSEDQRRELARRLKQLVGNVNKPSVG